MTIALRPYRLDVAPAARRRRRARARTPAPGLTAAVKSLPPKYFYDERGSELFERITRAARVLPDPHRAARSSRAIADGRRRAATGVGELVELGSGSSRKTAVAARRDARGADACAATCPSTSARRRSSRPRGGCASEYPGLDVHGVVGDFDHHLGGVPDPDGDGAPPGRLPRRHDRQPRAGGPRRRSSRSVADLMGPDDILLVGTDLAGDPARIQPAYDDAEGVTAEFNLNVLRVLNRELGRRLRPRRLRARRALRPRPRPGSRCGCAPSATRRSTSGRSTSTSRSPRARRCAPRSPASSRAETVEDDVRRGRAGAGRVARGSTRAGSRSRWPAARADPSAVARDGGPRARCRSKAHETPRSRGVRAARRRRRDAPRGRRPGDPGGRGASRTCARAPPASPAAFLVLLVPVGCARGAPGDPAGAAGAPALGARGHAARRSSACWPPRCCRWSSSWWRGRSRPAAAAWRGHGPPRRGVMAGAGICRAARRPARAAGRPRPRAAAPARAAPGRAAGPARLPSRAASRSPSGPPGPSAGPWPAHRPPAPVQRSVVELDPANGTAQHPVGVRGVPRAPGRTTPPPR